MSGSLSSEGKGQRLFAVAAQKKRSLEIVREFGVSMN